MKQNTGKYYLSINSSIVVILMLYFNSEVWTTFVDVAIEQQL